MSRRSANCTDLLSRDSTLKRLIRHSHSNGYGERFICRHYNRGTDLCLNVWTNYFKWLWGGCVIIKTVLQKRIWIVHNILLMLPRSLKFFKCIKQQSQNSLFKINGRQQSKVKYTKPTLPKCKWKTGYFSFQMRTQHHFQRPSNKMTAFWRKISFITSFHLLRTYGLLCLHAAVIWIALHAQWAMLVFSVQHIL